MPGRDSSAAERGLALRLTWAAVLLVATTAAFSYVHRLYAQKFFGATGSAAWIWADHPISSNMPVAFFAVRDFNLPENRYYVRLKVLGDPEYAVYLNGREIGARQVAEDRTLDVYELTERMSPGRNRVVVAVRAPKGVGGLIASVDLAPESKDWFPTGADWKIFRRWHPELLRRDPPGERWERPIVLGEPPIGRWDFLRPSRAAVAAPLTKSLQPAAATSFVGLVPTIRTSSGISVAVTEKQPGVAFDFGVTRGRVRLHLDRPRFMSDAVPIRYAYDRSEFDLVQWNPQTVVFAPGETAVTLPEEREFRYVLVYGKGIRAEVLQATGETPVRQ
jgi:hypothetical protein